MLMEFATNELEDMEGELAGRCNSLTQQQGMRVCVGLNMIWLDFMSRRPLPLENGETTISKLCPICWQVDQPFRQPQRGGFPAD